jgi:hypothetical protein
LVGKNTIDILTNKTLTAPTITGAGAIAGVFTGNITGNVTGNADTVTTNADLTGSSYKHGKCYCYSRWGNYHGYAKTFANF